jgi:signal transduction histidine kinase/CheY-like chemotaxis protein
MTTDSAARKQRVALEPEGLSVPVGSRVAYIFSDPSERTRFAPFIACGLAEHDKCVIVTDEEGRAAFSEALARAGVAVGELQATGALLFITDEISIDSIEPIAVPLFQDVRARFRASRCINDTTWMRERGWRARDFLRFEVKGHLFIQRQPATFICQYDVSRIRISRLDQIIAAHQYTVVGQSAGGVRLERNPDRRPLGQIIFDRMDEQLRALTRLQDLSMKLTATLELDQMLDSIIEAVITVCRADYAAISYFDEAGELLLMRHRGLSEQYINSRRLSRLDPAVASLVAAREPVVIEDVDVLADVSPNYSAWKREGVRSIVTLPLVSEGEVFGMVGAGSSQLRHYNQTETDAMAILAAQASAAIINARLFGQLRKANQAKDEFLATLSHELRTPLTPILGWIHILKPFADKAPILAQGLEAIERNATQQAALINDLLDVTRVVSGKIELTRAPTDLSALVQSAVEHIRPQTEARHLSLTVSLPRQAVVCNIDKSRIQQVMANLLSNAIKFTPDGGEINVTLSRDNSSTAEVKNAVIEVVDNGIGIAPEFLPQLFERFTQAHGGINRRYGGLGLGLAIIRTLAEMHGGSVRAESRGEGHGSRFTVWLPTADCGLRIADSGMVDEEQSVEDGSQSAIPESLRVLVIEDSRDTLDMLRLWLVSSGCEVEVATGAEEGLKLADLRRPDLIISDIGMPEIDGYEFMRRVRATAGLERVPAIALTGYAHPEDRELALAAGYDAHLAKPAEMSDLLALIQKLAR